MEPRIPKLIVSHYLHQRSPLLDWNKELRIADISMEANAAIYAIGFVAILLLYTLFWYFGAAEFKMTDNQKGIQSSTPEVAPDVPNRPIRHTVTPSNRSVMII